MRWEGKEEGRISKFVEIPPSLAIDWSQKQRFLFLLYTGSLPLAWPWLMAYTG
jgi:hypothetical protein